MSILINWRSCLTLSSWVGLMLLVPAVGLAQADSGADSEVKKEKQVHLTSDDDRLHAKLGKYLTGTKWTGNFTMTGQKGMKEESYEIISAEKGEFGDDWNLVVRIRYGDKDATLPMPPIEIKFAGGTPVITVDKVTIPGFGVFDARVVIRKGKYAGTWAHSGGVGGHLFGTIEKMKRSAPQEKEFQKQK